MQHSRAVVLFSLIFCASALPQDRGIIQCDPGSTAPVPAWNAPGRPHVVEQLSCGQMVSVLGVESFVGGHQYSSRPQQYVKI